MARLGLRWGVPRDRRRKLSLLGEALTELANAKGFSYADVAQVAGVRPQYLSAGITDGGHFGPDTLERIETGLGLSEEECVYLELAWAKSKHTTGLGGAMQSLLDRAVAEALAAQGVPSNSTSAPEGSGPLVSAWFRLRELSNRVTE